MRTAFCVQYSDRPAWVDEVRLSAEGRDVFELCWAATPGAAAKANRAIHFPKSTWTEGRNRLVQAVRDAELRIGRRYDYILLADDDIRFEGMSHGQGISRFEAALAKYNPAVAAPNYGWHFGEQKHVDKSAEVQGIYATDALLNAIHRDAWWVLLPYWGEFDALSWWNSAHVQNRIAGTTYRGAVVSVNTIFVYNDRASEYPRAGRCVAADEMIAQMARPTTAWHAHQTKASFLPQPLDLQPHYRRTRAELSLLWDVDHRYWQARAEEVPAQPFQASRVAA